MNDDQGTLVSVSLDKLRAFDLNPRITRNPNYEEIKNSIKNRGLDHPPQITKRPGEDFYIIASGGNTRLAILNELWLETHDNKYRNIICVYRPWSSDSLAQGNLHCLLGHLIENEMRGSLTFIERALAVANAVSLYQDDHKTASLKELAQMLCLAGYPTSPTQLSIMSATITFLLPYIPELLYSGLSRRDIDKLLALRSGTGKFWEKWCAPLSSTAERSVPLFDDIFALALSPFDGPAAGFSLEHIQDELTGLVSQTLNIDYNEVALITDARARKRTALLGTDPVPELPDISEQRCVDLRYLDKKPAASAQYDNRDIDEGSGQESNDAVYRPQIVPEQPAEPAPAQPTGTTLPHFTHNPQTDTPQSLASLIDQTAFELAGNAGLEFLIAPADTGLFDITVSEQPLTNEAKIYWQMLAFLAGKLPGSAAVWRQMLTGSPDAPAGFNDVTLEKIFQLIGFIRRFYEKQHQGGTP